MAFGDVTRAIEGPEYTLADADHHVMLTFANACAITVPAALPDDFACGWEQQGDEPITFVPGHGVTFTSRTGRISSIHAGSSGGIHAKGDEFRLIGI